LDVPSRSNRPEPPSVALHRAAIRWSPVALVILGVAAFGIFATVAVRLDPRVVLLLPDGDARWIKAPTPTTLVAHPRGLRTTAFRSELSPSRPVASATIEISALRTPVRVQVDGRPVHREAYDHDEWKRSRVVTVPFALDAGPHSIVVFVSNEMGPPAVRVVAPELGLASGSAWESTDDGLTWKRASLVTEVAPPWIALRFPPPLRELLDLAGLWMAVCLAAAVLAWRGATPGSRAARRLEAATPGRLRYALQLLFVVYGVHTLAVANMDLGADSPDHYAYVHWFAEHHTLPRVEDGAQFFQAPLFYALAGGLHRLLALGLDHEEVDRALRLLPIACGLILIECMFRMLRLAFPTGIAAQRFGLLSGACVPLLIYKTQFVGNEAMAGAAGACAILSVLYATRPGTTAGPTAFALAGVLWGVAVLTKISALALAPPFAIALAARAFRDRVRPVTLAPRILVFVAAFALTCAWFLVANQVRYDKLLIGGWDPEIGYEWWQPPAYRTPRQYLSFGASLQRPVYASHYGFWDGLYSSLWFDAELSGISDPIYGPKWNYRFAQSALLWAMVPTIALLVGALRILAPGRAAIDADAQALFVRRLSLYVTGAYLASLLWHSLTLPYYNAIKASYALAALPCLVVLIAVGLEPLLRGRASRTLLVAWLAGWVLFVGAGYWVLAP
jgi:hypothetical protein